MIKEWIKKLIKPAPLQTKENYIWAYLEEHGNLKCPKCGHATAKKWQGTGSIFHGFYINDASCLGCGTILDSDWIVK